MFQLKASGIYFKVASEYPNEVDFIIKYIVDQIFFYGFISLQTK